MAARETTLDAVSSAPLDFAELVDLEVQLALDADVDPSELIKRDAAIGERLHARSDTPRSALFRAWLRALEHRTSPSPGERVQAWYRLAALVAAAAALAAGGGTAAAILRYDGGHPVNVLGYLAVFVGLQIALVALTLLMMVPRAALGAMPGLGAVQEFVRRLGYRRAALARLGERARGGSEFADALAGRLLARQAVYARVERWMLTALTQRTAVFFNVGALLATVYAVSVRALAFAWSTTLSIDAQTMTAWLRFLALPWSWYAPAVPSAELVAASRYFPGSVYDPDLLGDWWPFLVASLVTYGLLPRLALAVFASWRARSARRSLALDHGECEALHERLTRHTRGWGEAAGSAPPGAEGGGGESAKFDLPAGGAGCVVVEWAGCGGERDGVTASSRSRMGASPRAGATPS